MVLITAGVRQNFGESCVSKKLTIVRTILLQLCFTKACYHFSYIEEFRVVFRMKSTVKLLFTARNFKNALFLTNPYYLATIMVK